MKEALNRLHKDDWRKHHPFSPEMLRAHDVLFDPYAQEHFGEVLAAWLQKFQPCLFGRFAAATHRMHYCILDEATLRESDEHIQIRIRDSLLAWKRRSVDPSLGTTPAHGFMLFLVGRRIAEAAPDDALLELAQCVRELWGCSIDRDDAGNDFAVETLYLRRPGETGYARFTFTIDYFGAQGDGRWWHDHRIPGGIAFTANSAGHMVNYREWYENKSAQVSWLVENAMLTIDLAAHTLDDRATWLLDLDADKLPVVKDSPCPFSDPGSVKECIRDKDWTRYGGHLYSDHSIRREFFRSEAAKPAALKEQHWLEDFAYLHDGRFEDHVRFVAGAHATQEEVDRVIGPRDRWRSLAGPPIAVRRKRPLRKRSAATDAGAQARMESALSEIRSWRLSDEELAALR